MINPRRALLEVSEGRPVDLDQIDPPYRSLIARVANANGEGPAGALLAYKTSSSEAAALVEKVLRIKPDATEWPGSEATQAPSGLTWYRATDIRDMEPEIPSWVVELYLAQKSITEFEAKIKVGKTTLLGYMVRAILKGEDFLGHPTTRYPVAYLTEERTPTFRAMLSRAGLLDEPDLHVLTHSNARGTEWIELIDRVVERVTEFGIGVVIIDTLPDWADLPGDAENSSGDALAAVGEASRIADAGAALMFVRHGRKAGGDIGDSARGSSAWGGAADILLSLRRPDGQGHDNRRNLMAVGRFDGIPPNTVIELREGKYVSLGEADSVDANDAKRIFLDRLPRGRDHAYLEDQCLSIEGITSRTTARRALMDLVESKQVQRDQGFGQTGRAYGYWIEAGPDDE